MSVNHVDFGGYTVLKKIFCGQGERNSESEVRAEEGVRKGPGDQAASSASVVTCECSLFC